MFNKETKKNTIVSEELKLAKIHTMKDDLANDVERQVLAKENNLVGDASLKSNSPFLSTNTNFQSGDVQIAKANQEGEKVNQPALNTPGAANKGGFPRMELPVEPVLDVEKKLKEASGSKRSTVLFTVSFVLILIFGLGGYYVWTMRGDNITEDVVVLQEDDVEEEIADIDVPVVEEVEKVIFSSKSNFFILNEVDKSQVGIGNAIEKKFTEMESYPGIFLEFVMVDENNTPIALADFMNYFKIYLNAEVMNNLAPDKFSLFLQKDKDMERMGIAINIKDAQVLKKSLLKDEAKLIDQLNSMFLAAPIDTKSKGEVFKDSSYGNVEVRYINLNEELTLSLDYAVVGDYLIFATSKECGRLMIDKITKENSAGGDIFDAERSLDAK
ncbi:MAG: hypothetical protein WAV16_04040 [Candidatus Moraniibacteriota bacterium]